MSPAPPSPPPGPVSTSCAVMGCVAFKQGLPCQCNSDCEQYSNCCSDKEKVCGKGPGPGPGPVPSPSRAGCPDMAGAWLTAGGAPDGGMTMTITQARPALLRSWVVFFKGPSQTRMRLECVLNRQRGLTGSHCRAPPRLPLPPAPRIF